jgi:O-antigen/teichoic acid export membrane protein
VFSGTLIGNAARVISTIIITKLLAPSDFGIAAVLGSILYIATLLSDLGFYNYIVRNYDGADDVLLDEVWTLRIIRGAVLAFLIAAFSWPLSALFGYSEFQLAVAVSGLVLLLDALTSLGYATASRDRLVLRLTAFDLSQTMASIVASIVLAIWLRSYWAILGGMIFSELVKIALSYRIFPNAKRQWRLSRTRAKEVWRSGRHLSGSSVIHLVLAQADKVALARLLPRSDFGLYSLASNIAGLPSSLTATYTSRIIFPTFVDVFEAGRRLVSDTYYQVGRPVRLLYSFSAAAFAATAPLIVEVIYDPRYAGAAIYIQVLAAGAVFKLSNSVANELMLAIGKNHQVLLSNLLRLAWLCVSGPALFALFGPFGIVLAMAGLDVVAQVYAWYLLRRHQLLSLRFEAEMMALAGVGLMIGLAINRFGLAWLHEFG